MVQIVSHLMKPPTQLIKPPNLHLENSKPYHEYLTVSALFFTTSSPYPFLQYPTIPLLFQWLLKQLLILQIHFLKTPPPHLPYCLTQSPTLLPLLLSIQPPYSLLSYIVSKDIFILIFENFDMLGSLMALNLALQIFIHPICWRSLLYPQPCLRPLIYIPCKLDRNLAFTSLKYSPHVTLLAVLYPPLFKLPLPPTHTNKPLLIPIGKLPWRRNNSSSSYQYLVPCPTSSLS